ncbi:MAG: autotransporter outer membrane beta-barrel domain-containing protein [Rhabdochlamydiaceae bacterium]|nr:autotransporter outer membrane beta-barrel domain-containing protein [Rhabdochlamydiaceae bacterium]
MTGDLSFSEGAFYIQPRVRPLDSLVVNNDNAKAVGVALSSIAREKDQAFVPILQGFTYFTSPEDLINALNEMQPALLKGQALAGENNALKVQDALSFRMQSLLDSVHCYSIKQNECEKKDKTVHVWLDGFGDILHQKSVFFQGSPQFGYQTKTTGAVLGIDGHFAEHFYAGALGAYTGSTTHWTQSQGNGSITSGYGGMYFSALGDLFYGNASLMGGFGHLTEHRKIVYPGMNATASNSHGTSLLLSHIDTGLNFGGRGWTLRPFDSLDYVTQTEQKFTETGAGALNLSVRKNNAILLRNELGLQLASCLCFKETTWTFSPKISWIREVRVHGKNYTATFAGTDTSFVVTGYFPDRSLVSPGALLSGTMLQGLLHLDLYYNGEFGRKFSDNSFGGELRFGF